MPTYAAPDGTGGEGAIHFFAREGQTVLLWTVYSLLGITVVTMIAFFPMAIIPATLLILAYLLLMMTNYVEGRSDHHDDPVDTAASGTAVTATRPASETRQDAETHEPYEYEKPWKMPLLKHETLVVSIGILAALVLAVVLAAIKFGGMALIVAVFFLFAYIVLLTAPVWMAALEDDIEVHS